MSLSPQKQDNATRNSASRICSWVIWKFACLSAERQEGEYFPVCGQECCCWGSGLVRSHWSFPCSVFRGSHVTAFSSENLIISSLHLFSSLCLLGLLTRRLVYIVWHFKKYHFPVCFMQVVVGESQGAYLHWNFLRNSGSSMKSWYL